MHKTILKTILLALLFSSQPALAKEEANNKFSLERVSKEGSWQANYGFSEAVIVKHSGSTLYLAGIGSNSDDDKQGDLLYPGDFEKQCKRVWSKIKSLLESKEASLDNLVRVRTYVTDRKFLPANAACQEEAYNGTGPYPPHTFLVISDLAVPGMLIEVEVTAALP